MDNVIDLLLREWNVKYPQLEKVEDTQTFDATYDAARNLNNRIRKEMNEIVDAVVVLYTHKKGRP